PSAAGPAGRAGLIRGASSGVRRHQTSATPISRRPFSTVSVGFDTINTAFRHQYFEIARN
ncbi:hypothetical protein U1708_20175, partial [Sphingomonas sp. ZB1N12]|uniref:hypothetical protein n=1 Tax=Sphingomonas arabinosi TaxID=3096160 RepID=UPI002FC5B024